MLRFVFRRLMWLLPALAVMSLVLFYLLGQAPPATAAGSQDELVLRRARLEQLPLFINPQPRDVTAAANAAVTAISSGDEAAAERGRQELSRLGGAALPEVIPLLDTLSPERRLRVALALAPIARRAGLSRNALAESPEQAVLYWTRFWQTHGVEFRPATARSAVARYARYGTEARAQQLRLLDTYALPQLMEALPERPDAGDVAAARRVVALLASATERDDRIPEGASVDIAEATIARWRSWWRIYGADYQPIVGSARAAGMITETRYAKWMLDAAVALQGDDPEGRAFVADLWMRLVTSCAITLLGLALAYLIALPLGAYAALRRRQRGDRLTTLLVLAPYVLTPVGLALLSLRVGAPVAGSWWRAAVLLALALLADPTRQQREQMQRVLVSDYVDAMVARGLRRRQVLWRALRNAAVPLLTRASLELPMAFTACFVLEKALGLDGLGPALLEAAAAHDARWLVACGALGATLAVLAVALSDLAQALLDPLTRRRLRRTSAGARG